MPSVSDGDVVTFLRFRLRLYKVYVFMIMSISFAKNKIFVIRSSKPDSCLRPCFLVASQQYLVVSFIFL